MNVAVILAGGIGTRMGKKLPKQYVLVNNKPVLVYTLEKFQRSRLVDKIVVVANQDWHETITQWAGEYSITKLAALTKEGDSRQRSTLNGLRACMQFDPQPRDIVLLHDAARPLLSSDFIDRCVESLGEYDGCIPVTPMVDAIYQTMDGDTISGLVDRSTLVRGQAPEVFRLLEILKLNEQIPEEQLAFINCSGHVAFQAGWNLHLILGEELNIKLTTPEDIDRMRITLDQQKEEA